MSSACATEECTGDGIMCVINRSSIYLLLAIMISLCCLTYELYASIRTRENTGVGTKKETTFHVFCIGFPIVLMSIGYTLDTKDPDAVLNVARHGFKCSMRFASMPLEWAFVWARTWLPWYLCRSLSLHCHCLTLACLFFLDFLWSGILIFVFSFGAWREIRSVLKISTPGSKSNISLTKSKRRLLSLAVQTSACLLLNMVR